MEHSVAGFIYIYLHTYLCPYMICFAIWPLLYHHHKLSKQVIKRHVLPSNNYPQATLLRDAKTSVENDC